MIDNKQINTPALRFPPFTEGWVVSKLEPYIELISGIALKSDEITEDKNGVPILRGINITEGFIRHTPEIDRYFVSNNLSNFDKYLVKENDLVLGMDGSKVGRNVALITKEDRNSILIQRVARVRANKYSDIRFIYQNIYSKKFHDYVDVVNTSSGIPHISSQQIKDFEIGFPTLPEQQKIAAFFTAIDKKLSGLKEKRRLLEQYKKGVMQQLFSVDTDGRPYLRFKDTEGGDFEDWAVRKLGELTYKTDKKNKENISYPVYSINNKEGFLPQSDQFEGVDSHDRGYDVSLYKIIQSNTFAYNPARIDVGSIGYSGNLNDIIISSLYVCFKTKSELNDDFLMIYLKSDAFNKSVLSKTEGGVRKYLFYENFSEIELPYPCLAEQTQIANYLSALDEKIKNTEGVIGQMETWKKGLLQQMFV
jgi:type I restriction enzyme, S subunit